jgi:hypothetical protein
MGTPDTPDETSIDLAGLIGFAFSLDGRRGAQVLERFTDTAVARPRLVLLALIRIARATPDGIVNLAARGMLVVSVALRLGSEGPVPAYRAAPLKQSGAGKGALSPLS